MVSRHTLWVAMIAGALVGCSASSTGPGEPDPPQVSSIARAEAPDFPQELGLSTLCWNGPDSPAVGVSESCPVLLWNSYTYWGFSYGDNRLSVAVTVFDDEGNFVEVIEAPGARYVWQVTVDEDAETVTFSGQDGNAAEIGWDEIRQ